MGQRKYPYLADLMASFLALCILILSVFSGSGHNRVLRMIGVVCLISAVVFWILPVLALKKFGHINNGDNYFETNVLVDTGIYALIRHPQYLAYVLLVTGFAFISQSWFIVSLAFLASIFFYIHTLQEEKELEIKFRAAYREYCKRVSRFNIIRGIIRKLSSN